MLSKTLVSWRLWHCVFKMSEPFTQQHSITFQMTWVLMCSFVWMYPGLLQVESSCNVMAHGDAREGKWRGNWQMEWVASTLHTTSELGVSSIITADAHASAASSPLNWRPSANLNGLANAVGSQYPSHYLGTWCIQHYYCWCCTPLLPAVHWTDIPPLI